MENNFVLDPDVNWLGTFLFCLSVFHLMMYPLPWKRCLMQSESPPWEQPVCIHHLSLSTPLSPLALPPLALATVLTESSHLCHNFTLNDNSRSCAVTAEQLRQGRAGRALRLGAASPSVCPSLPFCLPFPLQSAAHRTSETHDGPCAAAGAGAAAGGAAQEGAAAHQLPGAAALPAGWGAAPTGASRGEARRTCFCMFAWAQFVSLRMRGRSTF